MKTTELRDLIIRQAARDNGGGMVRWRKTLGELRVYPRTTHAHCNWDARPVGPPGDVAAIETIVDRVRLQHPFVEE